MAHDSTTKDAAILGGLAAREGFSTAAAASMREAVRQGGGSMAQFNHPEFGGPGQWMRGGMIMTGDMFNADLRERVRRLAEAIAAMPQLKDSLSHADPEVSWWPTDLGRPGSAGTQNATRYAYFPDLRRMAIDLNGDITVYDTGSHHLGGFSQQQSGTSHMTFVSDQGTLDITTLPVVAHMHSNDRRQDAVAAGSSIQFTGTVTAIKNALASVAVNDLYVAVKWYERMLGQSASRPMPEVAEWSFERGGGLQVYSLPERAGLGSFTLAVNDLEAQIDHLNKLNIDTSHRSSSAKVKTVMITDPDGNHVAFAEASDPGLAK